MTVWIYVNTAKQVGDHDHLKVFDQPAQPRKLGLTCTIPKAWPSNRCGNCVMGREAYDRFRQAVKHMLGAARNP